MARFFRPQSQFLHNIARRCFSFEPRIRLACDCAESGGVLRVRLGPPPDIQWRSLNSHLAFRAEVSLTSSVVVVSVITRSSRPAVVNLPFDFRRPACPCSLRKTLAYRPPPGPIFAPLSTDHQLSFLFSLASGPLPVHSLQREPLSSPLSVKTRCIVSHDFPTGRDPPPEVCPRNRSD